MSHRPSEPQKARADQLARLLAACGHPGKMLALMERLDFFGAQPERGEDVAPPHSDGLDEPEEEGLVGIWAPRREEGGIAYTRAAEGLAADPWAAVERIEPKGERKRVVLLGESVARGFFHDPHYNPAMALRGALSQVRPNGFEVIDLARTDQSPEPLLALCRDALALGPDALVVFAGNNWIACDDLPGSHSLLFADVLREAGHLKALTSLIVDLSRQRTETLVRGLGTLAREAKIPLVLMIPEFNLGGYATDVVGAAPLLPGRGTNAAWIETHEAATAAFAAGDWDGAAQLARRLIVLDGGTSSAAPALLAHCLEKSGDLAGARDYLELARDAELWRWDWSVPRCFRAIRETMVAEAAAFEGAIFPLDLADRFCQWLGGALPDQRLFMDYCHLSLEGARVAMASVAAMIAPLLEGTEASWRSLAEGCPQPAPEVVARGHFLAAVHNASWGQGSEVVEHHCRAAARHDSMLLPAAALTEFSGRRSPPIMASSYAELVPSGDLPLLYRLASLESRLYPVLTDGLVRAFSHADSEMATRLASVRDADHDVGHRELDLLSPRNHITSWVQPEAGWRERSVFFKAHTIETCFWFWQTRPVDLRFEITCRLPRCEQDPSLGISANERRASAIPLTNRWVSHRFEVAADRFQPGLNSLVLRWPLPRNYDGATALQRLADNLEMGGAVEFYAVLGEIASFTVAKEG